MDTTFPDSHVHYRSIDNEFIYHLGIYSDYFERRHHGLVFCLSEVLAVYRQLKNAAGFHQSKSKAVIGIMIGIAVWFFCFEVIGGEWFAMWQSNYLEWISQCRKDREFLVLSMILLQMKERRMRKLMIIYDIRLMYNIVVWFSCPILNRCIVYSM